MKRMIAFKISLSMACIIFLFVCIAPTVATADIVLDNDFSEENQDESDFFLKHREHILYLGRSFVVNSDTGFVTVRDAPDLETSIALLENGDILFVDYSCLYDGEFWGLTSVTGSALQKAGWVKLSELLVLYDYVAFEEDHIDALYQYKGNMEKIKEAEAMIAWSWPGSGIPMWTIENVGTSGISVAYAFMDDEGREWGFFRSFYGGGNIWVCISDPLNPDIPVFNPTPDPAVWISDTEHTDINKQGMFSILPVIAVVSALAISSVLLIVLLWKPNKENVKTEESKND